MQATQEVEPCLWRRQLYRDRVGSGLRTARTARSLAFGPLRTCQTWTLGNPQSELRFIGRALRRVKRFGLFSERVGPLLSNGPFSTQIGRPAEPWRGKVFGAINRTN